MAHIAFFHTSPVHVATFDALLREVAPQHTAIHHVREDLLARARRDGVDDALLVADTQTALRAAGDDARVVVCTCSTLGGIAEALQAAVPVTRVDRAMADAAVRRAAPVLMVAALQSTLRPTAALLQSSAQRLGLPLTLRPLWVESAWPHFEAGRHKAYLEAIETDVRRAASPGDTVVLAQASMAAVAEPLSGAGLVVLTSPRLGVEHAVGLCGRA